MTANVLDIAAVNMTAPILSPICPKGSLACIGIRYDSIYIVIMQRPDE